LTDIKPIMSTAGMADLLVCDERTVRDLAARNLLVRAGRGLFDVAASLKIYVPNLRSVASARGGSTAQENLSEARARLAAEQADRVALQNQISRGEMVLAEDVTARWSDICSTVRAKMLAIPTQAAAALPNMSRAELDIIDRLIRDGLTELADGFENKKGATDV
jgi:phage terminase Nu1 subunit (DNA packaging protein)